MGVAVCCRPTVASARAGCRAARAGYRRSSLLPAGAFAGRPQLPAAAGHRNVTVAASSSGAEDTPNFLRPERLALAAGWAAFLGGASVIAPSGEVVQAFDLDFVQTLIQSPFSGAANPLLEALFNSLGVMPLVYLCILLPGSKDQKPLPALPFMLGSIFLGYGALGPYLVAREQREEPVRKSELGWYTRTIAESKLNAAAVIAAALGLVYYAGSNYSPEVMAEAVDIWTTKSQLICASSLDLCVLSAAIYNPMSEDCVRRGWEPSKALPFCLLPVVGPSLYLLMRPSLEE